MENQSTILCTPECRIVCEFGSKYCYNPCSSGIFPNIPYAFPPNLHLCDKNHKHQSVSTPRSALLLRPRDFLHHWTRLPAVRSVNPIVRLVPFSMNQILLISALSGGY